MKLYVASSWRNPWQQSVVQVARKYGHEVYDFRHPKDGDDGFHWSEIDQGWQNWDAQRYRKALEDPIAVQGFSRDKGAMEWCDACVLVQPCGNSAHLELGWCVGQRKKTAVLLPFGLPFEPEYGWQGHSMHAGGACSACGDMDGCHMPAKLRKVKPELMTKFAGQILISGDEFCQWLS